MYKILDKKIINNDVEKIVVEAPHIARNCKAGQFIIIMVEEEGERVPLTIADYDRDNKTITLIYQKVGYSTKLLGTKKVGDSVFAIAGPLGKPVKHVENAKRILGIAGGVGAAPIYPQLKEYYKMGVKVDLILGARNEKYLLLEDEFNKFVDNIYITTDDGSKGRKGFVTQQLLDLIENGNEYDEIIAIGPLIMMKFIVDITKKYNIKTSVSLNPIMIDGTGMCGGCRLTYGGKTKFACVDGPDFDGFLVDFNELLSRQNMYKDIEEEHKCRLDAIL
jgi:NAD(P)H-flavin reductase